MGGGRGAVCDPPRLNRRGYRRNMIIQDQPDVHLTYCLNVHPGEAWEDCFRAIREKTLAVRKRVAPGKPFGLGLRLGDMAVRELSEPGKRDAFRAYLQAEQLYVFTINGFPYGRFHGERVKERVYQPDWRDERRREYTIRIADVLSELMPERTNGSISTVPGTYKAWARNGDDALRMAEYMTACVAHFVELRRRTGREIHLGLEPEPDCFIETTEECVRFFRELLFLRGRDHLARLLSCSTAEAEEHVRRHLGVCLDTAHTAIQFEDLSETLDRYQAEGIRLSKIQLSAALEIANDETGRESLRVFDEPVYLHQVRARGADGRIRAWPDLNEALGELNQEPQGEPVRVHFHVPLFWRGNPPLGTTASCLDDRFMTRLRTGACGHLEIETYTFDVLPEEMKTHDVSESIAREFEWVLGRWAE